MRYLTSFILFFSTFALFAQETKPVTVQVEQLPFGKKRFSIVAFKDYISLVPEFLDEKTSTDGSISLQFDLEAPRWIRLTGLGLNQDIIAIPGQDYRFTFENQDGDTYLLHHTENLPVTDPNPYRDSVNILMNNYLMRYNTLLFSGGLAKQTGRFCDSVEKAFSVMPDALFQTFLSYNLNELMLLAKTWPEEAMYKLRFENRSFLFENPDYAYAFTEFYKGRLFQILLKKKMAYGKELINSFAGADTVLKWIRQEPYYTSPEVGQGALLVGLAELLKEKEYVRDGILFLFHELSDSSEFASIRTLSGRLYKKFRLPVRGDQVLPIATEDQTGKAVEFPSGANKRSYVCFFDPASEVMASELAAMNELKKTLKDRMELVPIIINADKSQLLRLQTTLKLSFPLYRNLFSSSLVDYRLKSDCTCMVLSPDGVYVEPLAPIPSAPDASIVLDKLAKAGR